MSMDVAISLLVGLAVAGTGAALLLLAAWFRWGRSRGARRWARRVPIDQAADYATLESLALAWTPLLGQTLLAAGSTIPLVSLLGSGTDAATVAIGVLVVIEVVLWLLMLLMTVYRWILPLWMYPSWLRDTRRAEAQHLREQRGQRR